MTQKLFGYEISSSKMLQALFGFISFIWLYEAYKSWGVPIEKYINSLTHIGALIFDLVTLIAAAVYPILGKYSLSFSFGIFFIFCLILSLSKWESTK